MGSARTPSIATDGHRATGPHGHGCGESNHRSRATVMALTAAAPGGKQRPGGRTAWRPS